MRPTSTFTSSRHPSTIGLFATGLAVGGWGLFVPDGQSKALVLLDSEFATYYYLGLALSGLAGLIALTFRDHDSRTRAERCAWYGIGYSGLFYAIAALITVGPSAGQAALTSGLWALTATARILQIILERRRGRVDVAADLPADPSPLGHDDGRSKRTGAGR